VIALRQIFLILGRGRVPLAHVPEKACPREGEGGYRFSDKDMRHSK